MAEHAATLSIGDAAERTGLSAHTLRFYEREGILPDPIRRSPSGHRVYSEDDVEWLAICKGLRASGMPLAEIRDYVVLIKDGAGNEAERLTLLRRHQRNLTAQIDELKECFDWIEYKVGIYEQQIAQGVCQRPAASSWPAAPRTIAPGAGAARATRVKAQGSTSP
jgi:DNA-binding transcriptional MerR regulator